MIAVTERSRSKQIMILIAVTERSRSKQINSIFTDQN